MRSPQTFHVGYSDIARLTDLNLKSVRDKLGDLRSHSLLDLLNFVALYGKFEVKLDIIIYACAREKMQVAKWRKLTARGGRASSVASNADFSFEYSDLFAVTGMEAWAVRRSKSRGFYDPNDFRSVLVGLVARFATEPVKVGLIIRACQQVDLDALLTAANRRFSAATN